MPVSASDWQAEVARLTASLTADPAVNLLFSHHSKQSESSYLTIERGGRLYSLRLAAHPATSDDSASFNLLAYPNRQALIRAMRATLEQEAAGWALPWEAFAALALAEKANQAPHQLTVTGDATTLDGQALPAAVSARFAELRAHHLLLVRYRDQRLLLTKSGRAVLSAYYDFADYHQEARWDTNPRVESLAALLALL